MLSPPGSDVSAITLPYSRLAEKTRRNDLIEAHLGLVRHILGKLVSQLPRGVDVENLESAGVLGLVEAANKFDPERGIKFETYAFTRVRGAILDELRRNCPLPQHVLERVTRVRKAYERLPPGASLEDLSAASGLSTDEVSDCLSAMRLTRMQSWEGSADPLDAHVAGREPSPDTLAEQAEQKRLLAEAIQALPEPRTARGDSLLHGRHAPQRNRPGAQPVRVAHLAPAQRRDLRDRRIYSPKGSMTSQTPGRQ